MSLFSMYCVGIFALVGSTLLMVQGIVYVLVKCYGGPQWFQKIAGDKPRPLMKCIIILDTAFYWFAVWWLMGLVDGMNWWWPLVLFGVPIGASLFLWGVTQMDLTGVTIGKDGIGTTFQKEAKNADDVKNLLVKMKYYQQTFLVLHGLGTQLRESHLAHDLEIALKKYLDLCGVDAEIRVLKADTTVLEAAHKNQCLDDRLWIKDPHKRLREGYAKFATRKGVVYVELVAGSDIMKIEELFDGIRSIMERGCPIR